MFRQAGADQQRPEGPTPTEPATAMHMLTVELVRLLVGVGITNAAELSPQTRQSLEYCLTRLERYAPNDWRQIRDLQPLLLAVRRPVAG